MRRISPCPQTTEGSRISANKIVVLVIAHISQRLTRYFQKIAYTYGRKIPKIGGF